MARAVLILLLGLLSLAVAPPTCKLYNDPTVTGYLNAYPYCDTHIATLAARGQVLIFVGAEPADATYNATIATYIGVYQATRILAHNFSPVIKFSNRTVINVLWRFTCAELFKPCVNVSGNFFPQAPPRSFCDDLDIDQGKPKITLALAGLNRSSAAFLLAPDCASLESGDPAAGSAPQIAGQPRFPLDGGAQLWNVTVAPGVTVNIPVPALLAYPVITRTNANFTCNRPWHAAPPDRGVYCDRACPLPLFTNKEYHGIAVMTAVLSWIGYFVTLLLLVTMLLIKRYREYPASLVPFAVLGSNIIAFAFIFNMTWGWKNMICQDAVTFRDGINRKNAHCIFVAIVVQFGALITPMFWCAIAVNSFIAIYLKKDYVFKNRLAQPVTHVICWGVPTVTCIIALAVKRMGAPQLIVFCWVFDPLPKAGYQPDFGIQYPLFFIPLGILLVIGFGCITMVLWEMRNIGQSQGEFRYSKQIRLGAFLLVFWLLYLWVFLYRAIITAKKNGWTDLQARWYRGSLNDPTYKMTGAPSVGLPISFHIVAGVQGITISLLFGSSREVIDFWTERFRNIKEGRSFLAGMSTGFTSDGQKGVSSIRKTEVGGTSAGGGVFDAAG